MNASSSLDQTVRRACSGSSRLPPSDSASRLPNSPKPSSRRETLPPAPIAPSSMACSKAKNPPANTSAGLQAKRITRRSQRLFQASRMPVVAITPAAVPGRGRPCQPR
jgi:hypothetical protein